MSSSKMARKRPAYDTEEEAERAFAESVAAAMAASEREVVHTPSVKRKKKKPTTPAKANAHSHANTSNASNGRPHSKAPVQVSTPLKKKNDPTTARPKPNGSVQSARRTPMKSAVRPVKKEKILKYEPPAEELVEEGESDNLSAEVEEMEEEEEEEVEEEELVETQGEDDEDDEDEEEGEEEEEEIAAPVVFQCGTCRSIFADSYSFVCSNAELLLVTLSAVTNISLSPEAHTSREGADRGSSFHELLCKQCQTVLGRQYLTTPVALDAIRSLYSFSTTSIASYQLGYPQLSQVENGTSDTLPSMDEIKKANQNCDETIRVLSMDRSELLKLRDDMSKVQSLLVVVDERLHQLETQAEDSELDDDADEDDGSEQQQKQQQHRPVATNHRNRSF